MANDPDYKEFLDTLPETVFQLDPEGRFVYLNRHGIETLGYTAEEIYAMSVLDLVDPGQHDAVRQSIADIFKNQASSVINDWTIVTRGGERTFHARVSYRIVFDGDRPVGVRGILSDVSKRKALENKLRKSEERFRWLSDMAQEGIAVYHEGKIVDANKACEILFGYPFDEFIGKDIREVIAPAYHPLVNRFLDCEEHTEPVEIRGIRRNGGEIDLELTATSLWQEGKRNCIFLFSDISHRKQIQFAQAHDELTGLLNLKGFVARLQDAIDHSVNTGKSLAVMTIRVSKDQFNVLKGVNPDMERVLLNTIPMEIRDRLKSLLFKEDLIARTGENEYITSHILSGSHDPDNTVKLIKKVVDAFSQEFVRGIRLVANIGVTFFPDDLNLRNPARIVANSRYACEEAVFNEREYMFYDERSHLETRERIEFVKDLIVAVREERCRNFILFYQPKVDANGRITGLESLVRWKHDRWQDPRSGLVPPYRFIETAEEIGLIGEIGKWVLRESCRQLKVWHDASPAYRHLQVSVNVSPSQLADDFVEYVDQVLEETGLGPEFLELEITERESVKEKNTRILESFRNRRVSIAIDDFGIDYSSLSKLPKLSIDTIKLDKSYIDNIAIDPAYESLVNYTIKMVHVFKYKVIAEGVEHKEQADKLFLEMHCDGIQGYYFFAPMPVAVLEEKLRENLTKTPS